MSKKILVFLTSFILTTSLFYLIHAADANAPIFLYGCSKTTCELIKDNKHFATSLVANNIVEIVESIDCPTKCTLIYLSAGTTAHVKGNWLDISCRVWGGNYCGWIYPKDLTPFKPGDELNED